MARRRPITSHPAFAPFLAAWFAALLGMGLAVLPGPVLERTLGGMGLEALTPLTSGGRAIAIGTAALAGALLGLAIALPLARRGRNDPRPIYAEADWAEEHSMEEERVRRRPLHVREELVEADGAVATLEDDATAPREPVARPVSAEEGFMILTPQPVHPPRPAPDIDGLLAQFDNALAAFRSGDEPRRPGGAGGPDPVQAFVARQTGTPSPSPLGGPMPDHQAELRAVLDKLARAHEKD